MEHWVLTALLCILAAATRILGETFNETCVYNPCQHGGTCMNVLRPVDGNTIEYDGKHYMHVSSSPMTWDEANEYCMAEGGSLVGFEGKAEELFGKNDAANVFLTVGSTYWVSARYHGTSLEWKWYPKNDTFITDIEGADGDCMIYEKKTSISVPRKEPCNSTNSFICEDFNAWTSQCRCPPQYYGPFCEETAESATYDKAQQICEGEHEQVTCAGEQKRVRIEYAAYGAYDNTTCSDGQNFLREGQTCLALTSLQKIVAACTGETFCELDNINNRFFQSNPCTPQKHLDLRYQCVTNDPAVYNAPYPTARTQAPTMYCKERVYENTIYVVTRENTTVKTNCPAGFTGYVTFSCLEGGEWQISGPDNSGCTKIREAAKLDEEILAGNKTAVEIAATIEDLITGNGKETDLEADEVVNLLSRLNNLQKEQLDDPNKNTQERIDTASSFAERTLSIGNVLLSSEQEDDPQNSVSANLTEVIEDVAFIVAGELAEDSAKTVSSESIDMTCGSVPGGRKSLAYPRDDIFDMKETRAIVTMPASAFGTDSNTKTTLALLEYKNISNIGNKVFQPKYISDSELINKSVVNSILFGASATRGDMPVKTFATGEKIEFILPNENSNISGSVSCVFWDSTNMTETPSGSWSSKGCVVIDVESNRTHTKCACTHLTNFAILLDVTGVYEELSEAHITALEMLTIIGCSVSIGCLGICIFAFSFFKSLWNTRTTIHRNLCICLLTAQLLFLVGVERTENDLVCTVIAAVLHYTFLCSFSWMALEGIQLYIMLVHVFSTSSKVLPYYLAGYGLPAIVVAVAGGITKGEGYGQDKYCWLSTDNGFIWSFAGPVALIIVVNFVFLVVSIRIAYSGRAAVSKDATNSQNIKVWIKGAVTLTFLLGSTWGVGFFFLSGSSIPLAYVFTILNSLQGMFIFIYHCLGNDRIKKEMAKFLLRQPCLPACLRVRLEALAHVGSSVYSTSQSSAPHVKKTDTVALTEKKDVVHPVVYVQDVDEDDGKPRSWLYNRNGADETKVIPAADYPEPDYY